MVNRHVIDKELPAYYRGIKTHNGVTLDDIVRSGQVNPDSTIGVYAGDAESYTTFSRLFDPVISEYHGPRALSGHASNFNLPTLESLDPSGVFVLSTRIRVARNLKNFPFPAALSASDRVQLEKDVIEVLASLTGELAGTYTSINDLSSSQRKELIRDHMLFQEYDRFLDAAGILDDYPLGRGIFLSRDRTFMVWVGEEDNLRIIVMENGGDIHRVFMRLSSSLNHLADGLDFAYSDRLGYLTSCPSNLGTGMRASVHVYLPYLSQRQDRLDAIATQYNLSVRGRDGEHTRKKKDEIFDISPKVRLGISEVEIIEELHRGVSALIAIEKKYEHGSIDQRVNE
jgi:protein-arginine kinase